MSSSPIVKCILAAILLVATQVSAFAPMIIPISNGPTLDAKQGKIAGIGGLNGPKPTGNGGIGAFRIKADAKKAAPKAKANAKKVAPKAKANAKKDTTTEKKNMWLKNPWSK